MSKPAIRFGTSGWRAVIADEFTFGGVRLATRAIASYLRIRTKRPRVLVGHDTRFLSPEFAASAAEVLYAEGCDVKRSSGPVPTPALSYEIRRTASDGAINITASHNPADYNGLKFSGSDGAPALPEVTKEIEKRVTALGAAAMEAPENNIESPTETFHPRDAYFDQLERLLHLDVLRSGKVHFVCDALHGCGAGYLDYFLTRHGAQVKMIRANRDVLFDGAGPDPSEASLMLLRRTVADSGAWAGLATDGDADRFGIVDRDGSYVSPNHILALLFDYLAETRRGKGGVARSVATTNLMDAVARLHGREVFQTPVGFKYIGSKLLEGKILLGGEESCGMTMAGHVPEKDGILACLLVAEMIAARRASLADQIRDLFRRVGAEFWPVRVNLELDEDAASRLRDRLRDDFPQWSGRRVSRTDRTDGLKLIFDDGTWVLMRPSGTEPIVRIYAEAATMADSERLAGDAQKWIAA